MSVAASGRARRAAGSAVALAVALAGAPPLGAQQHVMARIPLRAVAEADSLRRLGIDVVEVAIDRAGGGTAVAVISQRDRGLLAGTGWLPEEVPRAPLAARMEARRGALGAAAFTVFRDFDDAARGVAAYLRSLAASRSNVAVDSIGASLQGRPILAVKVGPSGDSPSRPNAVFLATYHAREWASTEMALRLIAFLADSLSARPGGAALLAGRDVWVIPVANPDGYQYTFTSDRLWRKNRRANGDGSIGVDLNRNHDGFFAYDDAGSGASPGGETYRGSSAESEPETRAVAAFLRSHPPVVSVSYHSYGDLILYPWSHAAGLFTGDQPVFEALAGTVLQPAVHDGVPGSRLAAYTPAAGWLFYPTNGDFDGWAYRRLGTLAFTAELTSGCCEPGGGQYFFEFPDDEALMARVFLDNLPFALSLIAAAGDVTGAVGPTGSAAADRAFESLWPRAVVSAPVGVGALTLDFVSPPGAVRNGALTADSLGPGRYVARHVSADPALAAARAARVARVGLTEEVLERDGAEWAGTAWRGFDVRSAALEGVAAWFGHDDTLVSPEIAVAGRSGLRLQFWTRHEASLNYPEYAGRVEVSTSGGVSWVEVARVVGQARAWYPVSVPLAVAEGASSLMVRFVSAMPEWWVDAVVVAAGESRLLDSAAGASQGNPLELSANPVREPPLVLRWPASTGSARVQVFSLYGTLLVEETLVGDPGLWRWNLEIAPGRPVASGAYIAVLTRGDGMRLRRRFFVLRSGS